MGGLFLANKGHKKSQTAALNNFKDGQPLENWPPKKTLFKQLHLKKLNTLYAISISALVLGIVIFNMFDNTLETHVKPLDERDIKSVVEANSLSTQTVDEFHYSRPLKPDQFKEAIPVTKPQWHALGETEPQDTPLLKTPPAILVQAKAPLKVTRPQIAIIIDDMGMKQNMTKPFANLPVAIDFSFLPYADGLDWQTRLVVEGGHELMLHLPMEPSEKDKNPGPEALLTSLGDDKLLERVNWNLNRFKGFIGINNHMGSRFTENTHLMSTVLERIKEKHLFFIDSRTSAKSVGEKIAREKGLYYEDRDVFLDNILETAAINAQFALLEQIAIENGSAIAIGHPHQKTFEALSQWLRTAEARGFEVVKVSRLLKHNDLPADILLTKSTNDPNPSLGGGHWI